MGSFNIAALLIIWISGAGFIGSALIKKLVKKNYYIINIDKLGYASDLRNLHSIKKYKNTNQLSAEILGRGGAWLDAGSLESFYRTTNFVSSVQSQQNFKIACIEEIAYLNKWIGKDKILKSIKFYGKCEYSEYLSKIISNDF